MDVYDFSPILERLKDAKKRAGMTNEELSAASGVPIGTLRKILSGGTKEPKLPAFMAIASALGTSVDYLVYGRTTTLSPFDLNQEEINLVMDYRDSADDVREEVAGMLRRLAERNRKKKVIPSQVG